MTGSSPLTRGKPPGARCRVVRQGLIPTHAGKTPRRREHSPRLRAHPHSRGENSGFDTTNLSAAGSSPLTRGKPPQARTSCSPRGLIPTHAGKTSYPSMLKDRLRAHPHSRGENPGAPATSGWSMGSSPLTRGKRATDRRSAGGRRLIPTHAGKTGRRTIVRADPGAHPHSRGENGDRGRGGGNARGSSPLTRGKQRRCPRRPQRPGLIPTHAGKTYEVRARIAARKAHPHSRGENRRSKHSRNPVKGSSPLTRGKP